MVDLGLPPPLGLSLVSLVDRPDLRRPMSQLIATSIGAPTSIRTSG